MKKLIFALCFFSFSAFAKTRPFIMDHDGGVDDYAALAMLLLDPNIEVKTVLVCPADSFKKPAVHATQGVLKFLKKEAIAVAASDNAGTNPFPDKWRKDSERVEAIPQLSAAPYKPVPDAAKKLVELLSGKEKYEILETGPFTNIAEALKLNPKIKKNIKRIFVMGGAVNVKGNVVQPGHNQTAEWNIYNNPEAAKIVFESGIPITLVGLDATNKTPVTKRFMNNLKAQEKFEVSKLFHEVWKVIAAQIEHKEYEHTYYFWDTLAAAAVLDNKIIKTTPKKLKVSTSGENMGQTFESDKGNVIDVAVDANPEALEKMLLEIFKK